MGECIQQWQSTDWYETEAVDYELSAYYRGLLKPKPQQCFATALLTAGKWEGKETPLYTEGIVIYWTNALTPGFEIPIPFVHAFVTVEVEGRSVIVDPGDHPELPYPVGYLIGNWWTFDAVQATANPKLELPLSPLSPTTAANMRKLRSMGYEISVDAAANRKPLYRR